VETRKGVVEKEKEEEDEGILQIAAKTSKLGRNRSCEGGARGRGRTEMRKGEREREGGTTRE
jgi:hypothetical protein